MRLLLGLILGIAVGFFGLAALVGGIDMMVKRGFDEEAGVALGMGVILIGVAVTILVLSVKAHRRRRANARAGSQGAVDRGETEGLLMGVGMATLMNDDSGGDDFGD